MMKMTWVGKFSWLSYNEDVNSLDDNSFTVVGLVEQVNMTRDKTDYLWYTTYVNIAEDEKFLHNGQYPRLTVMSAGHSLHVFINGQLAGTVSGSVEDPRITYAGNVKLWAGSNRIDILSISVGLPNVGEHFETWNAGVLGPVTLDGLNEGRRDLSWQKWTYQIGMKGETLSLNTLSGSSSVEWGDASQKQPLTWYKDGEALTPVAQKAEAAGIPVVNIDRLFTQPDAATATILGDNYQIGVLAADYIGEELKCKGKVVEIQGLAGISVTEERTKGFEDEMKKVCPDGGIEVVAQQPGDFNPDKGLTVMENILQSEKEIDAVYTHDDDMAQGVVQAIRNADRDDEMFLTGVGGSQAAMEQIKEGGLYRATFLYNPNMAASAVNMARLIGLDEGFEELVPPEVPRQVIV